MENECIKMYIDTLIKPEYQKHAFNSYDAMIKNSNADLSAENLFIQIIKSLPKNCILKDYSKISTDWLSDGGFNLLGELIKNEYIEKDYLAYLYINRNRNIENRNYVSRISNDFEERGLFENILGESHEYIFDYAIKTKDVNFLLGLEAWHYTENSARLLSYLNTIEQDLSNSNEMNSYLSEWNMFDLLQNNDLGPNVIERLYQNKKIKLINQQGIDIILTDGFFDFNTNELFAELFYKSLSKPMKKYICENDDMFQEIEKMSRIERENKILRRSLNKKELLKKTISRI